MLKLWLKALLDHVAAMSVKNKVYSNRTSVSAAAMILRKSVVVFQLFHSDRVLLAMTLEDGSETHSGHQC